MPKEWYISFHGGEEKGAFNNIHVYSTDGKELRKALNKENIPERVTLRELRGFVSVRSQLVFRVQRGLEV